jgi:GDP/UDP-N,N'-diacetylbacillosamine 2-epimerase (hydrolysing)
MGRRALNIAVLTSSRADYSIWLPLLQRFSLDGIHHVDVIAFGTHLSEKHGYTLNAILADGFDVKYRLDTVPEGDSPEDISLAMGKTMQAFARFWNTHRASFDVVLCLGDRYEMFAAVAAALPFGICFAHLHGGETTLGAIDDAFRHSITHMVNLHFVSAPIYAQRVGQLKGSPDNIFTVGALGLDNIRNLKLWTKDELYLHKQVIVDDTSILCTFHPETVHPDRNERYGLELIAAIKELKEFNVLMTLPNADTFGNRLRSMFIDAFREDNHVQLVENLGTMGYMSAMQNCAFMLGNTSSGIAEAASFGKYVIDLGDRQKGRAHGENVIHVPVERDAILAAVKDVAARGKWEGGNMFDLGGAAIKIMNALESVLK